MGLRFEEQNLDVPCLPSRHDLDTAVRDRPVIIIKHDGHTIIANTKAIETAGVSASTPNPEGGTIDREADGYPSGPFRELAVQLLLDAMPFPDIQTIIDASARTFKKIVSHGITSAGIILQTDDEGIAGSAGAFDLSLMELVLDQIPINLYGILAAKDAAPIQEAFKSRLHKNGPHTSRRIGALKIWADGTFGSCTASVSAPFSDTPDQKGFLLYSPEELYRRMVSAHTADLQIAVHSIGDASTKTCLLLFDRLLQEHPRHDHRHRIEHASLLDTDLVKEIARLNLVVSTQPMFIHSEKAWLYKRLGENRARWVYPFRSLLDAGIRVAGASDAPIESINVMHAIQCCVTRERFETHQCITVHEAIKMFTLDAAFSQFEESIKGSISPGKRADFVVLNSSPVTALSEEIKDIHVEKTICGGNLVYEK
jgi:predicted amidohydrolase YtcJ